MKHISIEEARKESGYTADEIAEKVGVSRSQLYRIESGECQPPYAVIYRMRALWPARKVPDIAIYDPKEFDRRRKGIPTPVPPLPLAA